MRMLLVAILAVALVGCGGDSSKDSGAGGDGGGTGTGGSGGAPAGVENEKSALLDLARSVYDAKSEELRVAIGGAHLALGIPLVGEAELEGLDPRSPFLLEPQLLDLVDAFEQGSLVPIDGFFADLAEQGVKVRESGEPISRETFAAAFADYAQNDGFTEDEALFAFVFALSQVRAEQLGLQDADPLWGDGMLDPLQFSLLAQGIAAAEPEPAAQGLTSVRAALEFDEDTAKKMRDWGKGKIKGTLEGLVEGALQVPITPDSGFKSAICASLLIYGHKLTVEVYPDLIWHKQDSGGKPALAEVRVDLQFMDDYYGRDYPELQRWILENGAGCKFPKKGPAPGKPLSWKTGARLEKHGAYDITPSQTNPEGRAVATWRSVEEKTPEADRTPENVRTTADRLYVQVRDLVPGWKNLERGVAFTAADNALEKEDILTVNWYEVCSPTDVESMKTCRWSGRTQVTVTLPVLGSTSYPADVTFQFESYDEKTKKMIFRPAPGGSVQRVDESGRCAALPDRADIKPEDGKLEIDFSKDPPTYMAEGKTSWNATITCGTDKPYEHFVGSIWMTTWIQDGRTFQVSADGKSLVANGSTSADGITYSWEWDLRRK